MSPEKLAAENIAAQYADAPAASIEDNYAEYLDEECGFSYDIAERISPADTAAQDALLDASAQELAALAAPPDDLQRWMRAHAWERLGDMAHYFELCVELLSTDADTEHPLVVYAEISRRVARQYAQTGAFDAAQRRLRTHLERWPEDLQAAQLAALIAYLESGEARDEQALRAFAARFPEDAEIPYEIAEDLWHFERPEAARAWLAQAREAATQHDPATLVDVELLSARLARAGTPQ